MRFVIVLRGLPSLADAAHVWGQDLVTVAPDVRIERVAGTLSVPRTPMLPWNEQ